MTQYEVSYFLFFLREIQNGRRGTIVNVLVSRIIQSGKFYGIRTGTK